MPLDDSLHRLQKRLQDGEISPAEFDDTKARPERLQTKSQSRLNLFLSSHMNAQVVRGTVRTARSQDNWLTLDVEGRVVYLRTSKDPIQISPGDSVIVLVNIEDSVAKTWHNQTTGANELRMLRRRYRWAGASAGGFVAVALAIFITVFLAASHETRALIYTPVYVLSVLGAGVLLLLAFICLLANVATLQLHETMRAIIDNDPERVLKQVRRWLPRPKPTSRT